MHKITVHKTLTTLIALVWLINGLMCKVLGLVPRHEEIVAAILGAEHAGWLTALIGLSEIGMAAWVLWGYSTRINALTQMLIVGVMNVLEFALVPELLLWGKMNAVFAFLFICVVGYNEFVLNESPT